MARMTDSTYSGGMRVTNYTTEQLLMGGNEFVRGDYTNADSYPVELKIGTVFGRVSATGKLVPFESTANDGSQFPIGVLTCTRTVEDGETQEVNIVTGGRVDGSIVFFERTGDTLSTVVSGRQVKDHLLLAGLDIQFPTELSGLDNQ